jgi:hypothetical protein
MEQSLEETIYALETSLLRPEVRSSARELDLLLADDFVEFGSSGEIYDKKAILERLPEDTRVSPPEFVVSDFQLRVLGEEAVLATFKTDKILPDASHSVSLRASVWRKTNDIWQIVFHQGTPAR